MHVQAANIAGFRASEDPRFEAGIPDFMNGILNFSIHFNVVHRKVDWRNPKMKSLNSMPDVYLQVQMCWESAKDVLTLSSVLTYQCMYVGLCILHGRRHRGQGATAPPLWREGWGRSPSRRLHFDFKSRHPLLRLASFAYVVNPVTFTGCS